tara:strand:- start:2675 stop:3559 length:885 start_codon:yes stop_codon:yes gene_type:complete
MGLTYVNTSTYYDSSGDHGSYQFLSLLDIINSFKATYVGKGKICENVTDSDITFFATRGMQELSYDTLRSEKDWEVVVPTQLIVVMPHDYVNYVKLSWSDSSGIEHVLYPTRFTSNPADESNTIDTWGGFDATTSVDESSTTWENYKAGTPSEQNDDYEDDTYWPNKGGRYGISPENAQVNGSFYIDESAGKFHFSSNLAGKTLVLRYISDGMVSTGGSLDLNNTKVHKFAEEAIYKYMAYGLLSARTDTNPNTLMLLKKERFAEQRKAKIRLSNIKIEELTQIMRGKSKWIKH